MKRDVLAVLAVALLAAGVFFLTRETPPATPASVVDPYHPASGEAVLVRYVAQGGLGPTAGCEIDVRGPGDCDVRWKSASGRPAVERKYPLSDSGWQELLARLSRADFFEVDELPSRGSVAADAPTITLALTIGDRSHEVVVDGRRRPTKELGPVLEFFDGIRKAATPEPVSQGD